MTGLDLLHAALRSHDAFVVRALRYLAAEVGVRQFLDLGVVRLGWADAPCGRPAGHPHRTGLLRH
jgi:hypothetical protein